MAAIEGGAGIFRQFTVYLKNAGKSGKEERAWRDTQKTTFPGRPSLAESLYRHWQQTRTKYKNGLLT
jgi:hypothetical protein